MEIDTDLSATAKALRHMADYDNESFRHSCEECGRTDWGKWNDSFHYSSCSKSLAKMFAKKKRVK